MKQWRTLLFSAVALLTACGGEHRSPDEQRLALSASITSPQRNVLMDVAGSVEFDAQVSGRSGADLLHEWSFGDGRVAAAQTPGRVQFDTPGLYGVVYQVRGSPSDVPASDARTIRVGSEPERNYALGFFGNALNDDGRVKIRIDDPATVTGGPAADIGATDITIEFWMRGTQADNRQPLRACGVGLAWIYGNIMLDRDRYSQDRKFGISLLDGRVAFGVRAAGSDDSTLCGAVDTLDGQWHHIAVTRELVSGQLRIFVDGALDASAKGPAGDISYPDDGVPGDRCNGPCLNSDPYLVLGAEKHDVGPEYPGFRGELDELRLSSVLRYQSDFEAPKVRFVTDPATAALYHFDEGSGRVAGDSATAAPSPSNGILSLGGTPRGPIWVTSSAPSGQ